MTKEDYIVSIFRRDDCKRIIQRELNELPKTATIRDAMDALRLKWENYVCILDDNRKLLGIITERDILQCIATSTLDENAPATNIMTTDFQSVECSEKIAGIAVKLLKNSFKHLPIYTNDKLVGIISARDFIHYLDDHFAETVYNVSPGQKAHDRREGA
jgi:signal-transduction protein with cAMP-binding, CBS, and nucleotidyltransferase domain